MTTLIKNGQIYDGTGSVPVQKDILIRGGRIARIGSLSRAHAAHVIDATGMMVTPGFIDVTSHSDHHMSIFYEPYQEDAIRQGVTTIIGGNCGVSLAPLISGSMESIQEWGSELHTNINWQSVKQFLALIEKRKLGVNFGMLVGHTTIRRALTKNTFRDLTESELRAFVHIVSTAMKEGALGLSTGLEHTHASRTPYHELLSLVRVVAKHNGVYATHLRNTHDGLLQSIQETIDIAKETHASIEIVHLQPQRSHRGRYEEVAEILRKESSKLHINFDVNTFDSTPQLIYELLPEWSREESLEIMRAHIGTTTAEARLIPYFKENAPRDCIITHVPIASLKFLEGKSIREYGLRAGLTYEKAIIAIMKLTHLRATIATKTVDTGLLASYISHPNCIISSNSASFGKKEFKYTPSTETFPTFLRYVADSNIISMESAIEKITSLPAHKYGLGKRGIIKEGYAADIAIHNNFEPTHVFVNGVHTLRDGNVVRVMGGAVIRH